MVTDMISSLKVYFLNPARNKGCAVPAKMQAFTTRSLHHLFVAGLRLTSPQAIGGKPPIVARGLFTLCTTPNQAHESFIMRDWLGEG